MPSQNKQCDGPKQSTRIAIINPTKCKPRRCRQECRKSCPVVRKGRLCIVVTPRDKIASIRENLCIGCGLCVKKCPFQAITIVNLPSSLTKETVHRYHKNSFMLHRLPVPRCGQVLGIVGTNGIGKSTALRILSGEVKPNLGHFTQPPDWTQILTYFRGSELQNYFTRIHEEKLRTVIKEQYIHRYTEFSRYRGIVKYILKKKNSLKNLEEMIKILDLENVL